MTGTAAALAALLVVATGCEDAPAPRTPVAVDSAPATPAPTADPTPAEDPGPRSFNLVMGGDLLWHNTVWASAAEDAAGTGKRYDWDPMEPTASTGSCRRPTRSSRSRRRTRTTSSLRRTPRAAYLPTQWSHYSPGNPIRIVRATGAHLESIRHAVHLLGGNRGLIED
ncbi:hypothetical protein [Nocardioides pyridinolyticus]